MVSNPSHDRRPGLPPPRFGVGTLLLFVALLCVLLAATKVIGAYGTIGLILLALSVVGHVAGNAIGKRLRDGAGMPEAAAGAKPDARRTKPSPHELAPTTRLSKRYSLGKPIVFITVAGSVVSAALGGLLLSWVVQDDATIANMTLGVAASAVLGAIWTFIACSFLQVVIGALRQATREH